MIIVNGGEDGADYQSDDDIFTVKLFPNYRLKYYSLKAYSLEAAMFFLQQYIFTGQYGPREPNLRGVGGAFYGEQLFGWIS